MHQSKLQTPSLKMIHQMLLVKFDVDLNREQLMHLIDLQEEEVREGLHQQPADPEAMERLLNDVSCSLTGMLYPTEFSTAYYKKTFQEKLRENRNFFLKLSKKEQTSQTIPTPQPACTPDVAAG